MPEETLGYVEMEWTCRRCGTKNRGLTKTCASCGAQMEADQQFEAPAEDRLLTDAAQLAQAQTGPDRHCPYCGTRNPAEAKVCSQCGGDLTKAQARQAGQVVGAFQTSPAASVKCPACGTENSAAAAHCQNCGQPLGKTAAAPPPAPASRPSAMSAPAARPAAPRNWLMIGLAGVVGLLCLCGVGVFAFLSLNTTDTPGVVQSVHWERSIGVERRLPVDHDGWKDQIPAVATVGRCEPKAREMLDAPDPRRRSDKVCGTPYKKDQGNGSSRVVQDCRYQIYDDYCSYTLLEWKETDRLRASGDDLRPHWPALSLASGEREGSHVEAYQVGFSAQAKAYTFAPATEAEFVRFTPGSRWTLKVNGLGGVNDVAPAQ